jgi:hypothetical protein
MKLNFILLTIATIFFLGFVTATVSQTNTFYNGIIRGDNLISGTDLLDNVSVLGYVCNNLDCSSNGRNFMDLNSGSSSSLDLLYPDTLEGVGYGVYIFKPGYILTERFTNISQNASARNTYLYRKENCISQINDFNVSGNLSSGNITLSAKLYSALNNSGPLNYIPLVVADYYKTQAGLNLSITSNNSINITTSYYNIPFSDFINYTKNLTLVPGNYTINLTSFVPDSKCINSSQDVRSLSFTVEAPITPTPLPLPTISIISPENITYNTSIITINLQAINASQVFWNNGTTNITYNGQLNYNFSEGSHTIFAYANNSMGLVSANVTFSVNLTQSNNTIPDTTSPIITIISPNQTTYNTNNISLEITTNEPAIAKFELNNTNMTMIALNTTHFIFNLTDLVNGVYNINFYAIDAAGNTGINSTSFIITVQNNTNNQSNNTNTNSNNAFSSGCGHVSRESIVNYYSNETQEIRHTNTSSISSLNKPEEDKKDFSIFWISLLLILNIILLIILIKVILLKHS